MAVIVIFRIGSELCALERELVRQIAPAPALSRPPLTPPALAGFLNLAGEALPVIRAESLFGAAAPTSESIYNHVLILSVGADRFCLLVDRATDVRDADLSTLRPVDSDAILNGCVAGDLSIGDTLVHLLNGDRLLLAAERVQIEQLRIAEQARLDAWAAP